MFVDFRVVGRNQKLMRIERRHMALLIWQANFRL